MMKELSDAPSTAGDKSAEDPGVRVIAWRVEFENGEIELWSVDSIKGRPNFGRWITPLVVGGETVDLKFE